MLLGVSKLLVCAYSISPLLLTSLIYSLFSCMDRLSLWFAIHISSSVFQIVYSALVFTKVAMAYHNAHYMDPFFSHSIPLLSVHSPLVRWWYRAVCFFTTYTSFNANISCLQAAVGSIAHWTNSNLLCVNSAKTVLHFGPSIS